MSARHLTNSAARTRHSYTRHRRALRRAAGAARRRAEYVQGAVVRSGNRAGVAGFLKALLSDGALTGWYKELVAVRISISARSRNTPSRRTTHRRRKKARATSRSRPCRISRRGPYSAKEKLGFRLADACIAARSEVDDAFYAELKAHFTDTELVELFLTAAAFEMFPRFIDGLHIPVTPLPAAK